MTNFNISSKNMKHAEYGKPNVDEGLLQINLSYCLDPKTGLPIFYDLYPKSVIDVSYYKKMIDKVLNLRYKSAALVLDRGYFSKDNIENFWKH
ncbi:transposase [Mycoplasma sp. 332]|uniref:transposase n=1 Tax=Mycoplasma sp. 332 TaxID=3458236 RepID=UPI0040372FDD